MSAKKVGFIVNVLKDYKSIKPLKKWIFALIIINKSKFFIN